MLVMIIANNRVGPDQSHDYQHRLQHGRHDGEARFDGRTFPMVKTGTRAFHQII